MRSLWGVGRTGGGVVGWWGGGGVRRDDRVRVEDEVKDLWLEKSVGLWSAECGRGGETYRFPRVSLDP
jgi:hypothetical protein